MITGGKAAQLAFQYQNLFTVRRILEELRRGKLIDAYIEQTISKSDKGEIDLTLILESSDEIRLCEFYEVKSGRIFTSHAKEIKKNIVKLFRKYLLETKLKSRFFLIIHRDYKKEIVEYIDLIEKVSLYRRIRRSKNFVEICEKLSIQDSSYEDFFNFCQLLKIETVNDDTGIRGEILEELELIFQNQRDPIIMNIDHALSQKDLINRLVEFLQKSLKHSAGRINLVSFCMEMVDWSAKNSLAYKTGKCHDVQEILVHERKNITIRLNDKFSSVPLLVTKTDVTKDQSKYENN